MRAGLRPWIVALTALVVVSVRFDLAPLLRGPAPPPEWQWRHRPRALSRALPSVPAAAALAGLLAWSGSRAARRRPRRSAALVIAGGLAAGGLFPLLLVAGEDRGAVSHLARRTASPGYLSYHSVASSEAASDVGRFLRDYPRLLPELPVHAATHPPGPVLVFRGLIAALEDVPWLQRALDTRVRAACGDQADGCGPYLAALGGAPRAAALAGALLAHGVALSTLLPIAWLAFQLTRDPLAAARTAALWPLVPGAALFLPALDAALAFPVACALAGLRAACAAERGWARAAGAVAAATMGAVAAYLSYGSGLFLILGAGVVLASLPVAAWASPRRVLGPLGAVAALGLVFLLAPLALGHDPLASARAALALHTTELTALRSYRTWLVFGPLDFAMFLGVPVAVAFAVQAWQARRWAAAPPPARFALATALALAALFASGLVRGEVGRLFVPLMPLALIAGVLRLDDEPGPDASTAATFALLLAALDVILRLNWRI